MFRLESAREPVTYGRPEPLGVVTDIPKRGGHTGKLPSEPISDIPVSRFTIVTRPKFFPEVTVRLYCNGLCSHLAHSHYLAAPMNERNQLVSGKKSWPDTNYEGLDGV